MKLILLIVVLLLTPSLASAQSVQHNLAWTDTNSGLSEEVTTRIEQKINTGAWVEIGFVVTNVTTFSVVMANPFPGQLNVCYRVRAVNSVDNAVSSEACIQTPIVTPIQPVPPGQPVIQQLILP